MSFNDDAALDIRPAEEILAAMGQIREDHLIPLLQRIQSAYGYLPPSVLLEVSRRTGIPASRMYGVATFYEQFHLEPRGRNTIRCCRGTACHVRDGSTMVATLKRVLGIEEGETTADQRFTLETVACLGTCFLAPVMMINNEYYGHLTPEKIETILREYR